MKITPSSIVSLCIVLFVCNIGNAQVETKTSDSQWNKFSKSTLYLYYLQKMGIEEIPGLELTGNPLVDEQLYASTWDRLYGKEISAEKNKHSEYRDVPVK